MPGAAPRPRTPGTRHRQRAVRVSATACRKAKEASITQRKARVCIHCHCPGRGARLGCSRPRIRRKHRRATAWSTQYVHASGRAGLSMAHAVSPARHRAQVRRRPSAGWTRPLRSAVSRRRVRRLASHRALRLPGRYALCSNKLPHRDPAAACVLKEVSAADEPALHHNKLGYALGTAAAARRGRVG